MKRVFFALAVIGAGFCRANGAAAEIYSPDSAPGAIAGAAVTENGAWSIRKNARMKAFPVKGGARLDVSLTARVSAGNSVETLPQTSSLLSIAGANGRLLPAKFPSVGWRFLDAAGKEIKKTYFGSPDLTVYSSGFEEYSFASYIPENAHSVVLRFSPNAPGNGIEVKSAAFRESDPFSKEERLIGGDLAFDLRKGTGFGFARICIPYADKDGSPALDLNEGGIYTDPFPVRGGETLHIGFKGFTPPMGRMHCYVYFYPAWGNTSSFGAAHQAKARFYMSPHQKEKTGNFLIPADARWARLRIGGGTLRSITATMSKDKNAPPIQQEKK